MSVSLGRAHELGLVVSLTMATLIVLLGGAFPPWAWLVAFAPLVAMWVRRRGIAVPASSGTLLAVAAVGAGITTVVRGGAEAAVFAGGATLLGILAARSLTSTTLAHDLQAIALSLVLVLAGSVLNVTLSYFVVFVGYAVSTVWALATRQLLAGAEATGASSTATRAREDIVTPSFFFVSGVVSLAVLGAAVALFVSFPRIGFGELGFLASSGSRLPSSVGFGGNPRGLSTSTDVIARVHDVPLASFVDGLYLRAIVYDEVTLDAFTQSAPQTAEAPVVDVRPSLAGLARDDARRAKVEVVLSPVAGDLLMTLGHTTVAHVQQGGALNPNRSVSVLGRDRHDQLRASSRLASAVRYRLNTTLAAPGRVPSTTQAPPPLSDAERARYLKVDVDDDAVRALLRDALGADVETLTPAHRAERLRQHFLREYRYSLDGEVQNQPRALRAFLLDARAGHCELFAGGYALLLRMAGVPARVVGGFQGGALSDDGVVVFQARHAHAWVEWWHDDVGWIVDDATPEASDERERLSGLGLLIDGVRKFWDDRVLDYSLSDQQDAMSAIGRALRGKNLGKIARGALALGGVLVVAVVLVVQLRRARRRGARADRLGDEIAQALVRLGARVRAHDTLREAVDDAAVDVVDNDARAVFVDALAVYEGARFGDVDNDAAAVAALRRRLRALRKRNA